MSAAAGDATLYQIDSREQLEAIAAQFKRKSVAANFLFDMDRSIIMLALLLVTHTSTAANPSYDLS